MNNVVIELKLTTSDKATAIRLIQLLQSMSSGTKDATMGIEFHSLVETKVNIMQASYRERLGDE
jgi:hypothetical protein